ncbi:MAG TPA: branched-chain amino acid ABC transporter permease [Gaiellaceae bacterium]|jgi:branched-chain amino acid transport system permease protein
MTDVSENPPGTPPGDPQGPRIGVDEWVARSGERLTSRAGPVGAVSRAVVGVPPAAQLVAFLVFGALIPVFTSSGYTIRVATDTAIYALLAMGLNVAVGWAGLLDLGYIAYYGFAAYLFAMLSSSKFGIHWPTWASVPTVLVATILLGLLLSLTSRRLTGDYLAIVTLFFGQIFVTLTTQGYRLSVFGIGGTHDITGGPTGITNVDPFRIFGHQLTQVRDYLWLTLGAFALVAAALFLVNRSRTGRAWRALREDALAAELMSMPVSRLKMLAIAVGAGAAGLVGSINAAYFQGVFPTSFDFPLLITIYAMVILGGAGSLGGVVVGAVLINLLLEVLRTPDHARWVFYGVIVVGLLVKIRPVRLLAAVCGGIVAFGVAVNLIVGAVWPRGTAGPVLTSNGQFTSHGFVADVLRHWLVLPANTYTVPDFRIGNYAFVILVGLALTLTLVRGVWRYVLLVPTIWVGAFVWENRLVEESGTTRPLLLGAILIVLMAGRPEGIFGTPRVEVV